MAGMSVVSGFCWSPKELWVVRLDKEKAVLKDGMLEEAVDAVPIVDFLGESPVVIM